MIYDPLVSIIVPTFNREKLLLRSIETIYSQSYTRYEIIIIDDASTDKTENTVKKLNDKRIVYRKNEYNVGASESRNMGIYLAIGDYVSFLDSDDEWYDEKLECQINRVRAIRAQNWLCYTQVEIVTNNRTIYQPKRKKRDQEDISDYFFLDKEFIVTSSMLLPRTTILNCMFKPELRMFQDIDLCIRLAASGTQFIFVEKPLAKWNCDYRLDRITIKEHDALNRLKWFEEMFTLLTPESRFKYIMYYVLPLLSNLNEKHPITNKVRLLLQKKIFSNSQILQIAKKLNNII